MPEYRLTTMVTTTVALQDFLNQRVRGDLGESQYYLRLSGLPVRRCSTWWRCRRGRAETVLMPALAATRTLLGAESADDYLFSNATQQNKLWER